MQFKQSKVDALALSLQHDRSKKSFWQRLEMMNKKAASYPTSVSGVSGASKVAEMWGNHFGSLLNSITNHSCNNIFIPMLILLNIIIQLIFTVTFLQLVFQ